jgi:hypothetical protein
MAHTSIAKVPSAGVCIDRQDWLGHVNPGADDKVTWAPVAGHRQSTSSVAGNTTDSDGDEDDDSGNDGGNDADRSHAPIASGGRDAGGYDGDSAGGTAFIPARAIINSWKPAMAAFAAVWHNASKVVIINDHSNRLDMMEHVDGIYAEMGDPISVSGVIHAYGSGLAVGGPRSFFHLCP